MIRNNLAKLMIDRDITATQIFNDTGIARSTISKIYNNNTDKISLETIDKLCNYLMVTPADFFDYVPYEVEVKLSIDKYDTLQEMVENNPFITLDVQKIEVILNVTHMAKKQTIFFLGLLTFEHVGQGDAELSDVELILSKDSAVDIEVIKELPIQFQKEIIDKIKKEFNSINSFPFAIDFDVEIFNTDY
ncbi:helix-turn-helix domain-containing protein [Streptococcus parasanguinis]|jgi:transcriptional regulator, XRE family|uniref:helix-turn-helix domain-containing protein n=1 Tax=Streptococcus parasanguinis TaxID=1318 RepID=UPI00069DE9A0|nr:helix-turn-helix transcriptional regulator [Streptococcus parasanguinis]